MVSVDGSVFIQIFNFLFLIWVLNIVLYRPIRKIVAERKIKISGLEANITASAQDAKEKETAFQAGVKEARSDGVKKKDTILQEAAKEEKAIIEEINKRAQANLAQVRDKIAKDAEGVRISLQKEVDVFASAIGSKILGRAI